jgi:hypothetical protein
MLNGLAVEPLAILLLGVRSWNSEGIGETTGNSLTDVDYFFLTACPKKNICE